MIARHHAMILRLVDVLSTASPNDYSNQDDPLSESMVKLITAVYYGVCGVELNVEELHRYHHTPEGFYGIFDPQQLMGMALDVIQRSVCCDPISVEQFVELIQETNPPFVPLREFLFEVRSHVSVA